MVQNTQGSECATSTKTSDNVQVCVRSIALAGLLGRQRADVCDHVYVTAPAVVSCACGVQGMENVMAKKMLVVYYSWSNGNTEGVAERLAKAAGADLEEIETVEPYPDDHNTTVDQGHREVNEGFEPELEPLEHNVADYDVIAVGTPTWWYTMAPAVKSFFSSTNLAGKTVVPFMTNAGWPGTVIDDMSDAAEAAGAKVGPSMEVRFDSQGGARQKTKDSAVNAWIETVKQLLK